MSMVFATTNGGEVLLQFVGIPVTGVQLNEHEFTLEEFAKLSLHALRGGFFGWNQGKTPPAVNEYLNELFQTYEPHDGEWVRRDVAGPDAQQH